MILRALRARPVLVPFKRPPVSASGGIPRAALVLIDLETDGGVTGRSYVFGFAPWTLKPIVGCAQGLVEMIKGDALRALRPRGQAAPAAHAARHARAGRPRAGRHRHGGVGRAGPGRGVPLVHAAGRGARAGPRLQQLRPVDPAGGDARRRGRAARSPRASRAVKLRIGPRRSGPGPGRGARGEEARRRPDHVMSDFNQRLTVNEAILRGAHARRRGPVLDRGAGAPRRLRRLRAHLRGAADADPDRREPGGHLRDGAAPSRSSRSTTSCPTCSASAGSPAGCAPPRSPTRTASRCRATSSRSSAAICWP